MTLVLITWYLIGFISALIEFIQQNKRIFGRKEIQLKDLLLAAVIGVGGIMTMGLLIIIEILIGLYDKYEISMEKVIWRAKDDN